MTRLTGAWRVLEREQRLAALCALGLFLSMFLPWYSKTVVAAKATQTSLNAFQDFSFVEAAVLVVSAGVLAMLFARAEQRRFQLPGGDGLIVMIAGGWTALLVFYRLIDKPGLKGTQRITATVGVQWGIFIALLVALGLLYAGARMRAAAPQGGPLSTRTRSPRPQAPGGAGGIAPAERVPVHAENEIEQLEDETSVLPARGRPAATPAGAERAAGGRRSRYPPAPPSAAQQMSFEDPPAGQE